MEMKVVFRSLKTELKSLNGKNRNPKSQTMLEGHKTIRKS